MSARVKLRLKAIKPGNTTVEQQFWWWKELIDSSNGLQRQMLMRSRVFENWVVAHANEVVAMNPMGRREP